MLKSPNRILEADSYKFSQWQVMPNGFDGASSYIEARVKNRKIVPLGISLWIQNFLATPLTQAEVDEAEAVCLAHGEPFYREGFQAIIDECDGYWPVHIRGVPEGTVVNSQTPLVTVEAPGKFAWVASFLETSLQRAIWYPTTIASIGREMRLQAEWFFEKYSDNPQMLGFMLNDFGARGATSRESAAIGGLAHLVNFCGTDNIQAILAARQYYGADMPAYSVPASEHSVQCSFGADNQRDYLAKMLDTYAKPGAIVSIVLDGYDVYREANLLCTEFRDQIVASGAKVVFRPDSGDMFEVVPRLLQMQADAFGFDVNSKGKRVIRNVGVIQGDGIDPQTFGMLIQRVVDLGYAPESVIMGSGGGLLQKVTRDTLSFAQKTSAVSIGGVWQDSVKNPVTDTGKRSKGGRQSTEQYVLMYSHGLVFYSTTLDQIRELARG